MEKNHNYIRIKRREIENLKKEIPFLAGRPRRVRCIGRDDIVDLKILLATSYDVNHFVSRLG